jgi:hypothetical protein
MVEVEVPRWMRYREIVAPLFGVDDAQARDAVEVPMFETLGEPGAVGAVATCTLVVAVLVPFAFVAVKV